MKGKIKTRQCPKCRNTGMNFLPWLGIIYECRKCGYRGPLLIENRKTRTTV